MFIWGYVGTLGDNKTESQLSSQPLPPVGQAPKAHRRLLTSWKMKSIELFQGILEPVFAEAPVTYLLQTKRLLLMK